jgi:drug/metabolite transporter (DMT)-like permease
MVPSVNHGRWCILLAAVLWSLSGGATRVLQHDILLGLHEPALTPMQLAFFRALFAGLFLLPFVRSRQVRWQPLMPAMVGCFALMNALFVSALALGPAANAILLQNTAPFFVYIVTVFFLGEKSDNRSLIALCLGMVGMVVIVGGSGLGERVDITLMAVGSGLTYGCVILFLRSMRDQAPQWLSVLNHLGTALCLAGAMLVLHGYAEWIAWLTVPTAKQLLFLACFGSLQMGLPYYLFARGLRSVHPQEAGAITLLEPLLNPLWAYLVSPVTDTPTQTTWLGGALIIGALAYRYLPRGTRPT